MQGWDLSRAATTLRCCEVALAARRGKQGRWSYSGVVPCGAEFKSLIATPLS
jgi:hypothetical protein